MSGSLKSYEYRTRDGLLCFIQHDESNMEGAIVTPVPITAANIATHKNSPPANLQLRQLIYKSDSTVSVRYITPPTEAIYNDAVNGTFAETNETFADPTTSEVFRFSREIPEKRLRVPSVVDTGLDDGDQP